MKAKQTKWTCWAAIGATAAMLGNLAGCVSVSHYLHQHTLVKDLHEGKHLPYYHCPHCGTIVPKHHKHVCHLEPLPNYGYQAPCWRPWPADYMPCPPPEMVAPMHPEGEMLELMPGEKVPGSQGPVPMYEEPGSATPSPSDLQPTPAVLPESTPSAPPVQVQPETAPPAPVRQEPEPQPVIPPAPKVEAPPEPKTEAKLNVQVDPEPVAQPQSVLGNDSQIGPMPKVEVRPAPTVELPQIPVEPQRSVNVELPQLNSSVNSRPEPTLSNPAVGPKELPRTPATQPAVPSKDTSAPESAPQASKRRLQAQTPVEIHQQQAEPRQQGVVEIAPPRKPLVKDAPRVEVKPSVKPQESTVVIPANPPVKAVSPVESQPQIKQQLSTTLPKPEKAQTPKTETHISPTTPSQMRWLTAAPTNQAVESTQAKGQAESSPKQTDGPVESSKKSHIALNNTEATKSAKTDDSKESAKSVLVVPVTPPNLSGEKLAAKPTPKQPVVADQPAPARIEPARPKKTLAKSNATIVVKTDEKTEKTQPPTQAPSLRIVDNPVPKTAQRKATASQTPTIRMSTRQVEAKWVKEPNASSPTTVPQPASTTATQTSTPVAPKPTGPKANPVQIKVVEFAPAPEIKQTATAASPAKPVAEEKKTAQTLQSKPLTRMSMREVSRVLQKRDAQSNSGDRR